MRLSNRRKAPMYNFVNTFIWMMIIGGIALFFLEIYVFDIMGWESILLLIIPLLIGLVYLVMGRQIFEYESEGEVLNFKNRSVNSLFLRAKSDEFPKYKLQSYDLIDLPLYKRLFVIINSKKTNSTTLTYDISFLSKKEISDLQKSLTKVIKNNKEKV